AVQDCIQRICINPATYPEVYPHFRRGIVHRFPFAVAYNTGRNHLEIYAVMHLHREPEYWKYRAL
ncbi:MAG TPA: type II toxin-antitoxin system RelE/ParE family toxin, partial [Candidatus Hydrogenedentes bacterium]|nr:type II toxin-antitoxin system RelE/ParE family toxin [Candidatus Hydrogenedentota bacterium]